MGTADDVADGVATEAQAIVELRNFSVRGASSAEMKTIALAA